MGTVHYTAPLRHPARSIKTKHVTPHGGGMETKNKTTIVRGHAGPGTMNGSRFDTGRLVLDSDTLQAAQRQFLSPSTALALQGCAASWIAGRTLQEPWRHDAPNITGNIIHNIFEQLYNLPPENRTNTAFLNITSYTLERLQATRKLTDQQFSELAKLAEQNYDGLCALTDPTQTNVAGTEVLVQGDIAGVPFRGYADRIDLNSKNEQQIVDYKTGKAPTAYKIRKYGDSHGNQIIAYSLVIAQNSGTTPQPATLLYTADRQARTVTPNRKHKQTVRDLFLKSWDKLSTATEQNEFLLEPTPLCGWCPLVSVCPAGPGVPKKDGLPAPDDPRLPGMKPATMPVNESPHGKSMETTNLKPETAGTETVNNPATNQVPQHSHKLYGGSQAWNLMAGQYLNGASYAVQGTMGTITLSVQLLKDAKMRTTKNRIETLSRALENMVTTAQTRVSVVDSPADGIATRLRGSMRTFVEQTPPPIGDGHDAEEMRAWGEKCVSYMCWQAELAARIIMEPQPRLDLDCLF